MDQHLENATTGIQKCLHMANGRTQTVPSEYCLADTLHKQIPNDSWIRHNNKGIC